MRTRLFVIALALLVVIAAVNLYVFFGMRPSIPQQRHMLFPSNVRVGFYIDVKAILPALPAELTEQLTPRMNAIARSSKLLLATTGDMRETYIVLREAPEISTVADLIDPNAQPANISGFDGYTVEGGCIADIGDGDIFGVFGEGAMEKMQARLVDRATGGVLPKDLQSRFEDVTPQMAARVFGFPEADTPVLLPVDFFRDLQRSSKFFSFRLEKLEQGGLYARLLTYFEERAERDLKYLTIPDMHMSFMNTFSQYSAIASRLDWKMVKNNGILFELNVPAEMIDSFFESEPEPSPTKSKFVPDLSELPF